MPDKKIIRKLTEEAAEIFGSKKAAKEWLNEYSIHLQATPLAYVDAHPEGANIVSDFIGQIKYGVYL